MSGPAFFQTPMGRRFFEQTLPQLVKQIERLAEGVEALVAILARLSLQRDNER